MLIAIDFKDGRVKEFDTASFTGPEAMRGSDLGARNIATEFDLRLDQVLEGKGIRLDYYWYDVSAAVEETEIEGELDDFGDPITMPVARRKMGGSILIADEAELRDVARVVVSRAGNTLQALWRQGSSNWLIIGSQFEAQRVLTYTDRSTTSLNAQSLVVYDYLRRANPAASPAEIAGMMGYPLGALAELQLSETLQASDSPDEAGGEDDGERDWYGALLDDEAPTPQD